MSKSSELDQTVKAYIISCIDNPDHGLPDLTTTEQKIGYILARFNSECGHEIARVGRQSAVMNWLQGLPSGINIEFMNYQILILAETWGSISVDSTERQQDKILANYWNFMAVKLCQLFDGYRVPADPDAIVLECSHVDTCLPDYWSGHHLAHIQIPVWRGMSLAAIKRDLRSEINMGAIAGDEDRTREDNADLEPWCDAAILAINKIKPAVKNQRRFFMDLEKQTDEGDGESVYAFFVFAEL